MGLPSGWMAAESNSNLGVVVYENVFTEERIAWVPHFQASDVEGESADLDPHAGLPLGCRRIENQ